MKKLFILIAVIAVVISSCKTANMPSKTKFPNVVTINGVKQNPEGIEFNKNDQTFLLSSLNAGPIVKINLDGAFKPFTSGEKFPLSTAGLQIDYKHNRLLVAAFNGLELMDKDPKTKGTAFLRIYNLKTGVIEQDINLSSLLPDASAYFANDIAVDNDGNAYISDWYAGAIYKVDLTGKPSVFWKNNSKIKGGPNGLDYHSDGYLLVSLLNVNDKGLYSDFGLVKIPISNPTATIVNISGSKFTGFDGMIFNTKGNIVGVTNNGTTPGGNLLIELSGQNEWKSAKVIHSKAIKPSTTVSITPNNKNYVINQDFTNNFGETWTIEQVQF